MVKLTADLIGRSPFYINAIREQELDLRNNKISAIENLGATKDGFDSIDFSNNDIQVLENMPQLTRLSTLIMNNNKIEKINRDAMKNLPNLKLLILNSNKIGSLEEVEKLNVLRNLEHLSLIDNPVTSLKNYRLFVIHHLPWVRILDLSRVKLKERQEAKKIFGNITRKDKKTKKTEESKKMTTEENGKDASLKRKSQAPEPIPSKKTKLSEKEIFEAIQKVKTKEELEKLEKLLSLITKTK